MSTLVTLALWILMGAATAYLANRRGRDPYIWFAIGIFLGIFGVLILLLLPRVSGESVEKKSQEVPDPGTIIELLPIDESVTKEWFFIDISGNQQGPMPVDAMKKYWLEDGITGRSFVWSEGMAVWKRIDELRDLKEKLEADPQEADPQE